MCSYSSLNFSKKIILNCQAIHRSSLLYSALLGALLVFFGGVLFIWFFMILEFLPWCLHFFNNYFPLPDFKDSLWQKQFFSTQLILGFWTCLLVSFFDRWSLLSVYFCVKPWPSSEVERGLLLNENNWKRLLAWFLIKWSCRMGSTFAWFLWSSLLDSWA